MSVRWPFTARNPPLLVGNSRKVRLNYVPLLDTAIIVDSAGANGDLVQTAHTIPGLPASAVAIDLYINFACATLGAAFAVRSHGGTVSALFLQNLSATAFTALAGKMAVTPGLTNQIDLLAFSTAAQAWVAALVVTGYYEAAP